MKKGGCFVLVFLILWTQSGLSQYNIRTRDNSPFLILYNVHLSNQNKTVVIGDYCTNTSPFLGRLAVYELGSLMDIVPLYKQIDTSNFYYMPYPKSTFISMDGGVCMIGGTGDGTPGTKSFFFKTDQYFRKEFNEIFQDTNHYIHYFTGGFQDKDSSFYLANISVKQSVDIVKTTLYKLDRRGTLLWKKYYPCSQQGGSSFPNLILPYKKSILIGSEAGYPFGINGNSRPLLLFIDTAGSVIKEQYLEYRVKGINGLVVDSTDYSIVYCSRYWDSVEVATGYPCYRPYISKVDSGGNKKWGKALSKSFCGGPELYSSLNQVKRLADHSYLSIGSTVVYETDTSGYIAGYLVKFKDCEDSVQILWERRYRGLQKNGTQNYLYDFVELPDKRIIACGESNSPADSFPQQGWILGLDSFGCLVPGCESWTAIKEGEAENLQFRLFPNPAADYIYMDMQGVSAEKNYWLWVYDMAGRVMLQTTLNAQVQYSMNTSGFKAGAYVFELRDEQGQVVGKRKIIKE